jgi:rfaE bifunctional protein nucleotidyltransferase chain/domain
MYKLEDILSKFKDNSIVLTNGCFDIIHRGHIEYLNASKTLGDILVVGINTDSSVKKLKGETRPINNELDRAYVLSNLKCVDYVFIFDDVNFKTQILTIRPTIYTKAGDYTLDNMNKEERDALISVNAEIKFMPFIENFSTTKTINKIKS